MELQPNLPLNRVLTGDCLEILPTLPENSIDLIFADPPYNLQLRQELWRPNMTRVDAVDEEWDRFAGFQAYDQFTRGWLTACRRVLKRTGTLWVIGTYHNIYRVGTILQDLGFWILNEITWIKNNPMPNFRGVRFTNAHENLIWVQKERGAPYTFNHHAMKSTNEGLQMRSDWYLPICTGKERLRLNGKKVHPTQKPEGLLYRIILASSNPGDVVLDPFFGTGTTGVVARRLCRNWIGIEQDKRYAQVAWERIQKEPVPSQAADTYTSPQPRKKPRIPFGALVECGFLQAGQEIYFEGRLDQAAIVQADGSIRYRNHAGSIHQVGRQIHGAPCNGWVSWYYQHPESGELSPIDSLRQRFFKELLNDPD